MRNVKYGWRCTDPDCIQYMRRDGDWFEMIQIVSPLDEEVFFVVRGTLLLSDCTDDDIENDYVLSLYGYSLDELYRDYTEEEIEDLIMECYLEQTVMRGADCIINKADSFEEAECFVKELVEKEGVEE